MLPQKNYAFLWQPEEKNMKETYKFARDVETKSQKVQNRDCVCVFFLLSRGLPVTASNCEVRFLQEYKKVRRKI